MQGMGSQVSCSFDVAANWMVVTFAGSLLESMENQNSNPAVSFNAREK